MLEVASNKPMAELQHDRAPYQAAPQTFALDGREFPVTGAVMTARLFAQRTSNNSIDLTSKCSDSTVCLAIDMLAASGGTLISACGNSLIVTFVDVGTAILASRRLQWAFQGLSEADRFAERAVAIMIYSGHDLPGNSTSQSLSNRFDQALPGEVLLTEGARLVVDNLPGLALESIPDSALRQMLIPRPDGGAIGVADEQTLFRNIKGRGSEELYQQKDLHEETAAMNSAPRIETVSLFANSLQESRPNRIAELWSKLTRLHWAVWAGSAAAVSIVAIGLSVIVLRPPTPSGIDAPTGGKSTPSNGDQTSNTGTPQAGNPSGHPPVSPRSNGPTIDHPQAGGPITVLHGSEPNTPLTDPPLSKAEPAPPGRCVLGPEDALINLSKANREMHNSNYQEAQMHFESVLSCPGTSKEARAGLSELKHRMEDN